MEIQNEKVFFASVKRQFAVNVKMEFVQII